MFLISENSSLIILTNISSIQLFTVSPLVSGPIIVPILPHMMTRALCQKPFCKQTSCTNKFRLNLKQNTIQLLLVLNFFQACTALPSSPYPKSLAQTNSISAITKLIPLLKAAISSFSVSMTPLICTLPSPTTCREWQGFCNP